MIDYARTNPDAIERNATASDVEGSSESGEPYVTSADALQGDAVFNRAGERLGRLHKIVLDVPGGRIAYGVLCREAAVGAGDKLLAIPWQALTPDPENECFVLDVTQDQLEHAPAFDKDHWPPMEDGDWAREVHTFYRARPYYWA